MVSWDAGCTRKPKLGSLDERSIRPSATGRLREGDVQKHRRMNPIDLPDCSERASRSRIWKSCLLDVRDAEGRKGGVVVL